MKEHLKALFVVALFIGIGSLAYLYTSKPSNHDNVVSTGDKSPELKLQLPQKDLKLVDGKILKPSDIQNKIVIVNFWASWCAPCVEEVPSLIELTKKSKDLIVLAISGDSKQEELMAFMKSFPGFNKEPFYQVWDNNSDFLKDFNIVKLPESYIFNRKGEMVKRVSGTINWNTPDSEEYFKSLE